MDMRSLIIAHKIMDESSSPGIVTKRLDNLLKQEIYIVEFDIRQTRDGSFIVAHDKKLFDFPKPIEESSLAELQEYSKGKQYSLRTLDEALRLIPQKFQVNIELKDKDIDVGKFMASVKQFDISRFIVSSFYPKNLLRLSDSGIQKRWLLTSISYRRNLRHFMYALQPIKTALRYKATGIASFYRLLTSQLIKKAHKKNLTVTTWTVNDKNTIKHFKNINIDWIISDIT